MRSTIIGLWALGLLLTTAPAASPKDADAAAVMRNDAQSDRWQGRQHYLYDETSPPQSGTTGMDSGGMDARACTNEPVRLRRSDGSTVVRRMMRCR
jgi:hypothetical protein